MAQTILVPMDGSEASEQALEYAIETYPEAAITVLHVIDLPTPTVSEFGSGSYEETAVQSTEQRADEIADRARAVASSAGYDGELEVTTSIGTPSRSIIDRATDVDAIVMGSHGRHGASRILLGSVAETVVRRAPVPVTVVR